MRRQAGTLHHSLLAQALASNDDSDSGEWYGRNMSVRTIIGTGLLFIALPFIFLGLIDPLEGGISLLGALAVYGVSYILLKRWPPKYLWIPFVVTFFLGAATLAYAVATLQFTPGPSDLPIGVQVGIWAYRIAVLVTLAGGIIQAVQSVRRGKGARRTPLSP